MDRRHFLLNSVAASAAVLTRQAFGQEPGAERILDSPVLDAHIHLFDPTRAGGVSWPEQGDPIYRITLPQQYEALARPQGIVGAIAIEASPLAADNDWLLNVVRSSPVMVGMIGDLPPLAPDFAAKLDRLRRDPLFLGIRHGNLWDRSLAGDLERPQAWTSLERLARANLVFETANPDLPLLEAALRVANRFPALTVVVDHLPHMEEPATPQERGDLASCLARLAQAPQVFIKLSEIPQASNGRVVLDPAFYRARLDQLWTLFGPDRVIFGSDWPNSDHVAPFGQTLGIVREYIAGKTGPDRHKYLFGNSQRAYHWRPRRPNQGAAL